jgi:outer membrane protein assembly factor BamB
MRQRARLFACILVLLTGGTAVAGASPGVDGGIDFETLGVETQDPDQVRIADALGSTAGETELLVSLSRAEDARTPAQLRAHANRTQVSLLGFAEQTPGLTVEGRFWLANAVVLSADTDRVPPETLARIDGVDAIGRNAEVYATPVQTNASTASAAGTQTAGTAANQTFDTTYGLAQIDATEVWTEYNTRGEGSTVAVLDSGIDADHPDLNLSKWAEFSIFGGQKDTEPNDPHPRGHGTHTSGTVAGGNASGQHIGVAPRATLYHGGVLRNCDRSGCTGTLSQIIAGMEWAVKNDADVVSMSLGGGGYSDSYVDAVRNAEAAGTIVVASIGNDGAGTSGSPGNVYDTLSVGAAREDRDITGFSSGERIDTTKAWGSAAPADWPGEYVVPTVSAPGAAVYSTLPNASYGEKWGTSMAAPHVSGTIALMQSATEDALSPDEIRLALTETATKPADAPAPAGERDIRYGAGIIDAPAAVDLVTDGLAAGFGVDPFDAAPGTELTFDASRSVGNVTSYEWDLTGNGTVDATGQTVSFTYESEGNYNVTLTATDANGTTDTAHRTLRVREPAVTERWAFQTGGSVISSPTIAEVSGTRTAFVGSSDDNISAVEVATGDLRWAFETNGSVRSSPAVVNVSGVGPTVYVGSGDGHVYALNATTGTERWTVETGGAVKSSPAVVDDPLGPQTPATGGTVFVGSDDGDVYALDGATGEQLWTFATDGPVRSSPTVVDISVDGSPADWTVFVGSNDDSVYAIDAATGTERWQYNASDDIISSPTVARVDGGFFEADGWTVFVGSGRFTFAGADDTHLYALNATTGDKEWRFDTGGAVRSSPTVANVSTAEGREKTVFVGSDDNSLYAIDAAGGDERWSFTTGGSVDSSPTVATITAAGRENETVFVGSWDTNVYAVNATTGTEQWRFITDGQIFRTSPTVAGGTVVVGSEDNALHALDTGGVGTSDGSRIRLGTLGHTDAWADQRPTALFAADLPRAVTNRSITFDAAPTTGDIVRYEWDVGDQNATGQTVTPTFETAGDREIALTVVGTGGATATTTWTLPVSAPPAPVVGTATPRDPDGDGLYEAVRGDDAVTVLDVQVLFNHLDSPAVTDSAWAFDFADTGPDREVTVLDVQALFDELSASR